MKTEVVFDHKKGIVTATFSEALIIEEVAQSIDQIITDSEYTIGMSAIYDVTHANLSDVDSEKIDKLSTQIERLSKGRIGKPRVAIVSEHSLNFGTMRLFKEYYKDKDTELEVFESLKQAENWLIRTQNE